jgi:hypothetical protein
MCCQDLPLAARKKSKWGRGGAAGSCPNKLPDNVKYYRGEKTRYNNFLPQLPSTSSGQSSVDYAANAYKKTPTDLAVA